MGHAWKFAEPVEKAMQATDQPTAGLITDLSAELLDDTLVVWGGEFGRTVYNQGEMTRELRPRPPSPLLQHLDGGRWCQRRHGLGKQMILATT